MLTKGDEYPIHQTPEPVAYAGSDRNFYDRFFWNGYNADGSVFFAAAMGVYPHLNVIDAAVSVLRGGKQTSVFFSRPLGMERMDTHVGGFSVEVVEPLKRVHLRLEETEGVALDLQFEGRAFPIEEPRFTYRQGPRMLMDVTRMTQNGSWSGTLSVDGERHEATRDVWRGTRDRSWGVRPIGSPDAQPLTPVQAPQFYWIWTPTNFPNLSMFFHVNDDGDGNAWNTRAVLAPDGAEADGLMHLAQPSMSVAYAPGTRRMASAELAVKDGEGRDHSVSFEPVGTFLMKGIGYGHPERRHGAYHGEQVSIAREEYEPDALPWQDPANLHIQAIVKARHAGPNGESSDGVGAFEQLFLGPHAPSGFKDILDGAE
ncbi:MAG: hypothetical protein AAFX03_00610 [Pseudomonadota bacterium]